MILVLFLEKVSGSWAHVIVLPQSAKGLVLQVQVCIWPGMFFNDETEETGLFWKEQKTYEKEN